jgi:hypothetical protein
MRKDDGPHDDARDRIFAENGRDDALPATGAACAELCSWRSSRSAVHDEATALPSAPPGRDVVCLEL